MSPSASSRKPEGGEFELIARLAAVLGEPNVLVGIGDDCAATVRDGAADLYTTDTMVDGVHFRAGQIPWFDLGWKAIAVNVSDIAAMGGSPSHALVTLGLPEDISNDHMTEVYQGVKAASDRYGAPVIGGDVVRSPVLFVTVAMVGTMSVPGGQPGSARHAGMLLRSSARPGEQIAVTGSLGCSAGGVRALATGLDGDDVAHLKRAQFAPKPRLRDGQILASHGVRTAIDVSDGLAADLRHVCEASGVAARLEADSLPVHGELRRVFPEEWRSLALTGGEDYELLFSAPLERMSAVLSALETPATVIGRIAPAVEGAADPVTAIDARGDPVDISRGGWDHLSR